MSAHLAGAVPNVAELAGGNPFFLEQLFAAAADPGQTSAEELPQIAELAKLLERSSRPGRRLRHVAQLVGPSGDAIALPEHVYHLLRRIKSQVDPAGRIRANHPIPAAV